MQKVGRQSIPALIRVLAILLAVGGFAGVSVRAQQQRPQIEVPPPPEPPDEGDQSVDLAANLVTVTVVVRDPSGALVTNLTPDEFAVFEDGKRQDVDRIARQGEVPLRLALLFDASISIKKRLDFEKRAAERFFTSVLRSGDQAALISISTDWRLEQPLTGSAGALIDATERLTAAGITSLYGSIQGASKHLGAADGRRVIVLLSDGYDTKARETLTSALEAAQRSDIVIYSISPAGAGDDLSAAGKIGGEALRKLTDDTGGRAFFPPLEAKPADEAATLDDIYKRITAELQAQYVLTYYSPAPTEDKAFRTIRVAVTRPGVTVSARKGYYPKPS